MTSKIRIFEVGGSIRDEIWRKHHPHQVIPKSNDRDFVAVHPNGFQGLYEWAQFGLSQIYLMKPEFQTIRGLNAQSKTVIDIVLARKEGDYVDGRRPDYVEPGTLEQDLARRDFTINSMAYEVDPQTLQRIGDLIDPFGGEQDIKDKVLSCVGDAQARLSEDALRALRAFRFCVTHNVYPDIALQNEMLKIGTWMALERSCSSERIREELKKAFTHSTPEAMSVFHEEFMNPNASKYLFSKVWLLPTLESK
jgi:tRNA nucleotidyltransferase/poly(A) polymerase